MLKVWIAGAGGQIGRALNDVLDPMQIEALNTDVNELDITDTDEVINFGTVNQTGCDHQLYRYHRYG